MPNRTLAGLAAVGMAAALAAAAEDEIAPGTAPPLDGAGETLSRAGGTYGSFVALGVAEAPVGGAFEAEELLDAPVVNLEGDPIGRVEDLAIGADGRIRHAMIDVSGAGAAALVIAVSLDRLAPGEGDREGDVFVDMTPAEAAMMPAYARVNGLWAPATGG
jgi:sporulation protein YlmC with PRC-barrel domain